MDANDEVGAETEERADAFAEPRGEIAGGAPDNRDPLLLPTFPLLLLSSKEAELNRSPSSPTLQVSQSFTMKSSVSTADAPELMSARKCLELLLVTPVLARGERDDEVEDGVETFDLLP
jgi:hypothetical protein